MLLIILYHMNVSILIIPSINSVLIILEMSLQSPIRYEKDECFLYN